MAEEFQESEVMFQLETENHVGNVIVPDNLSSNGCMNHDSKASMRKNIKNKSMRNSIALSAPVKIPDADPCFKYGDMEVSGEAEFVPPHLVIGHRAAEKMIQFSVCTGHGRTLKGRDLIQVRNMILRMTGFH